MYTLIDKLKEVVEKVPYQIAAEMWQGEAYSYRDFYDRAVSVAYGLKQLGIARGDRVAIVLENQPDWGCVYFGILMAGAVAVPLDPHSDVEDFTYYFAHSESKVVFTSTHYLSPLRPAVKSVQHVIVLGSANDPFMLEVPVDFEIYKAVPDDMASIIYTSGTTGRPKGVMLTHANFYANFTSIGNLSYFKEKHNILALLPLHHAFPFMVTLIIPLFTQNKITYLQSLKQEDILHCMRDTGVTVLVAVPQFFVLFYKSIKQKLKKIPFFVRWPLLGIGELLWWLRKYATINLSKYLFYTLHAKFGKHLKYFACGGAKLDAKVELFLNKIGFKIVQGYGLTETAPVVTFNPLEKCVLGSAGKALPGVQVRIIEPDACGIGEVVIQGPNVMLGYFKQEAETKEVVQKGWFFSGDLGYLDADGYLYLTGRKKDIIVLSSGKNVSPEEVELHYGQSKYIKELCVVPVTQAREEKIMAVIVPDFDYFTSTHQMNFAEVIKWDLENFSRDYVPYKRIMGFVITKRSLPRTRLGKLKRYLIEQEYKDKLLGAEEQKEEAFMPAEEDLALLSSDLYKTVARVVQNRGNIKRAIRPDDHIEIDLGFDSLERVELLAALEKELEVKIPESVMTEALNMRQLIAALANCTKEISVPLSVHKRLAVWKDMLMRDPAPDIRDRIDLEPTRLAKWAAILFCNAAYYIFKVFFRLRAHGRENLPKEVPFILCPNHTCFLDAFFVASAVPNWLKLRIFFLGYAAYFEVPVIKNLVKIGRIIPIDLGTKLIDAMQACGYVLRRGRNICIFPEGARSIDGDIKAFKKGIGILAKELNIPLVPVYIKGAYKVWPRTRLFPRPYPVEVIFGKSQTPEALQKIGAQYNPADDYEAIALGLQHMLQELAESEIMVMRS